MPRDSDPGEVFARMQEEFGVEELDQQTIIEWLKSGLERSLGYKPATTTGLERFSREVEGFAVKDLSSQIGSAESLADFEVLDEIKIDRVQDDVRRQRESVEKDLVQLVKTEVEANAFLDAVEDLRELNSRRLGGIRSGQTRRGKRGFRELFGVD